MTLIEVALLTLGALVSSWILTGGVRRLALKARMLDLPNERSSHRTPTPRGGGLAIVISFLAVVTVSFFLHLTPGGLTAGLLGGGALIALVGLIDDRTPLPARIRFCAHLLASGCALWTMHGAPVLLMFGFSIDLGWLGAALATIYLVWTVNLYNFMDGIDGIASVEALVVALGGGLAWWVATDTSLWLVPLLFAACVGGFLLWNYPPAKIFMGDAGSGFIGFTLGALSLWSAKASPQLLWCWIILLGGFVVDATTTLIRRVRRGDKFHEAHRNHAYQYASRKHASHQVVTLAFGAIGILWLLPLALLVAARYIDGAFGTVIAYAPLVWLAFHYKAGARSLQEV